MPFALGAEPRSPVQSGTLRLRGTLPVIAVVATVAQDHGVVVLRSPAANAGALIGGVYLCGQDRCDRGIPRGGKGVIDETPPQRGKALRRGGRETAHAVQVGYLGQSSKRLCAGLRGCEHLHSAGEEGSEDAAHRGGVRRS